MKAEVLRILKLVFLLGIDLIWSPYQAKQERWRKLNFGSQFQQRVKEMTKCPIFYLWNLHSSLQFSSNSTSRGSFERKIESAFRICHWISDLMKTWGSNHRLKQSCQIAFLELYIWSKHSYFIVSNCLIRLSRDALMSSSESSEIIWYIIYCQQVKSYHNCHTWILWSLSSVILVVLSSSLSFLIL